MTALLPSRSSFVASTARLFALVVAWLALCLAPVRAESVSAGVAPAVAGTHDARAKAAAESAEKPEEGLTKEAGKLGGTFFTSSMLVVWLVAAGIIIFAQIATKRIRSTKEAALTVPSGAQNFWEFLVESLRNFLEEILGRDLTKKSFWFFATIFILILFTNWFGLLPGIGTIGWAPHYGPDGAIDHIGRPLFRGGNADLNMTFAMSSIFFVMWVVWALQSNGPKGFIKHLFGAKGGMKGIMGLAMAGIFILVGLLEVISILFRPVSLSFRLYGNIFAGENLLEAMQNVYRPLGWLTPIPFYFMELLVGLVQALVFMLLTAVFTLLICSHDEEHAEGEGHAQH